MNTLIEYRRQILRNLPAPLSFALFVLRRLRDDRCLEAAGSLTFTTLLALVPFLTIALSIIAAFPMFNDFAGQFHNLLLSNLLPESAGKMSRVMAAYIRQFTDNTGKLTALSMLTLAITALAMMGTIDRTINRIWRVRRQRNWLIKTLTYWAVLTLGPLLLGVGLAMIGWLEDRGAQNWQATIVSVSGLLMAISGLTLFYRVVPNCPVPVRHAALAATLATLALMLMKSLFGLYIKKFASFKLIYGAFASLPVFLLWLYLIWTIVLGGAVISAALSYWRGGVWRKRAHPGQKLQDAVRVLIKLDEARRSNGPMQLGSLRIALGLGQDELNELLERLSEKGWVECTRQGRWVLCSSLERITLKQLYHTLVTRPFTPPRSQEAIHALLGKHFKQVDDSLDVSLATLAEQAAQNPLRE